MHVAAWGCLRPRSEAACSNPLNPVLPSTLQHVVPEHLNCVGLRLGIQRQIRQTDRCVPALRRFQSSGESVKRPGSKCYVGDTQGRGGFLKRGSVEGLHWTQWEVSHLWEEPAQELRPFPPLGPQPLCHLGALASFHPPFKVPCI